MTESNESGTTPTAEHGIDTAAIRRAHFEFDGDCHDCEEMWPCDVEKVGRALDRQREEIKRLHRAWAEKVRGYDEETARLRAEVGKWQREYDTQFRRANLAENNLGATEWELNEARDLGVSVLAQRDDARARLDEIQRRCQLRIDMVRAQNPDNEYNPNTHPAWILVEDVLNVITPSRKYSQE